MVKPYSIAITSAIPELYFGLSDVLLRMRVSLQAMTARWIPLSGIGGDDAEHEAEQDEILNPANPGTPGISRQGSRWCVC